MVIRDLLNHLEGAALLCGQDNPEILEEIERAIKQVNSIPWTLPVPARNPSAPSHLTQSQAARAIGVTPQTIGDRLRRGTLVFETHFGTHMIPTHAVIAAIDRRARREKK